jgi:hypothetical protein
LLLRGFIIARKDWSIEYINSLDNETLHFVAYWLTKKEKDFFEYLGSMLGTNWNKEKLRALFASGTGAQPDEFLLPLAHLIAPNLKEILKPTIQMGDGEHSNIDGDIQPLTDMPKEEFLERYRQNKW